MLTSKRLQDIRVKITVIELSWRGFYRLMTADAYRHRSYEIMLYFVFESIKSNLRRRHRREDWMAELDSTFEAEENDAIYERFGCKIEKWQAYFIYVLCPLKCESNDANF